MTHVQPALFGAPQTQSTSDDYYTPAWVFDRMGALPPDALIVDPFLGSGTTLRAAKDARRRAIGIEAEERYCEIAAKRMAQEVLAL